MSRVVVRELMPDEAGAHASVVASGFGLPAEPFRQFTTPAVLALPGVRCYMGFSQSSTGASGPRGASEQR